VIPGPPIPLWKIKEAMRQLGYEAQHFANDVVVFIPRGENNPAFWPSLDASSGPIPMSDLIEMLEAAGVDRSVFLAIADGLG
jgi:hypothetical protein